MGMYLEPKRFRSASGGGRPVPIALRAAQAGPGRSRVVSARCSPWAGPDDGPVRAAPRRAVGPASPRCTRTRSSSAAGASTPPVSLDRDGGQNARRCLEICHWATCSTRAATPTPTPVRACSTTQGHRGSTWARWSRPADGGGGRRLTAGSTTLVGRASWSRRLMPGRRPGATMAPRKIRLVVVVPRPRPPFWWAATGSRRRGAHRAGGGRRRSRTPPPRSAQEAPGDG